MNAPQFVVVEFDGWIAKQLSELTIEHRWLVRETRVVDNALSLVGNRRPCVLIVQVEPTDDKPAAITLIADAHRTCPDVPVVAVGDAKLNDADRLTWTAALFDLGARYALFPPITKPVLEDVISGLMAAALRRLTGAELPAPAEVEPLPLPEPKRRKRRKRPKDEVIDLADEEFDG